VDGVHAVAGRGLGVQLLALYAIAAILFYVLPVPAFGG
jgi:hypothetical protein